MKKLLFCLLLLAGFTVNAQVYNNEWIDYSKTYYKFKVGKTGLHRIPQATLAAAGLGNTPAEHFQLWRNGVEVPIYTSVQTGSLSTTDYIEFWGEMNDGKPDKQLYRQPEYQLNDKWSLQTDTATYFLTINPSTNNLRLTPTANNVAGNTLAPEPYFMHTVGTYFKNRINTGRGVPVGSLFYSSSYDYGEGYSSADIGMNATNSASFSNLFVYEAGPAPKMKIAVSGNQNNCRRYRVDINGDSVLGNQVNFFDFSVDSTTFPLSKLSTNSASIVFTNIQVQCDTSDHHTGDRVVIHKYELTYPRQFNFGGASNFEFSLPASTIGNYLEITGFAYGTQPPVLLDLTNGKRYIGDIATIGTVKIGLQASSAHRKLVLVTQVASATTEITALQSRQFTDYKLAQNQGDYLIISNPLLQDGTNGTDPVEEYRQYRSSVNGGSFNAKIFFVEELTDQFAFGIKKHPMAIRNFVQFARNHFSTEPKHVFLIGKGVTYVTYRGQEKNVNIEKLNLVPTFGYPASDALLTADPGDSYPKTPVGRLSAVSAQEVAVYLKKVKDYESAQKTSSPYVKDKAWMKNVIHVVGSSEPGLQSLLDENMNSYTATISDTLFGAKVTTFTKSSADAVQQINNGLLDRLFEEGISLITYFGHSSSTTLEFNLNTPDQYNNQGKYPMFNALGCSVGDNYGFTANRLVTKSTLSESFVLAEERGSIGFIASSFLGIVHYLDIFNTRFYNSLSRDNYGKSIGEIMQAAIAQTFALTSQTDFYARGTCEEIALNGDPAIRINAHAKPDYVIEEQHVAISPGIVSVADQFFKLKAKFLNLGLATEKNIVIQVKREYPDQTSEVIFRDTIQGVRYIDSININIPIETIRDKGENKLTVTVDADNMVDELFETNNTFTKTVFIFEDEARPVYPYDFAIVNRKNIKLLASTANPFSEKKQYRMEIDTTELFNSPLKVSTAINSVGGILEFDPGISFTDSTVYYWRVGLVPATGEINWHHASFVYMPDHEIGFNQSHIYQHLKSEGESVFMDSSSATWQYGYVNNDVFVRHGTWASSTGQESGVAVYVNGERVMYNACARPSLVFNVFSPQTFKPWENRTGGLYGSVSNTCFTGREYNFEYKYTDTASRRKIMNFMKNVIPDGYYVIVRNFALAAGTPGAYAPDWMADTSIYGSNNSLYHYMKDAGLSGIDSFYRTRPWILIYKKGDPAFTPKWEMAEGIFDNITLSANCLSFNTTGNIISPVFGPASAWKELSWSGNMIGEEEEDEPLISVIGVKSNGSVDTLRNDIDLSRKAVDMSSVDASQYPFLQLMMRNRDTANHTPYQLKSWQLTYVPAPEGAIAPNIYFSIKDTVEIGEPLDVKIAFKNISEASFDSIKVKLIITDRNNVTHEIPVQRHHPLPGTDTLHVQYSLDTKQLVGDNMLYMDINPDNDQPEQYHFNNFFYRNFYVVPDSLHPVLDVTFDREHILNGDIVSARPEILIKLKDEAKWMLMDSSSLVSVKLLYPNTTIPQVINFDNDTLTFEPAQQTTGAEQNTANIHYRPYFEQDGDYELIVSAKDKSENQAGSVEYRIGFKVINKPMISNMLNYPNPFTSSTAFVFTITGSEVPQNLKIQILTITGKVVREITKDELGPLRIGRNITEFKWDGTDQYGQRLGNGVYLYRVVTNLNGKSLEKYKSETDQTDKYFNKGYGKMYLMR